MFQVRQTERMIKHKNIRFCLQIFPNEIFKFRIQKEFKFRACEHCKILVLYERNLYCKKLSGGDILRNFCRMF